MDNRTANRIRNLAKVSSLQINYNGESWVISGRPVSTGWPKADMVVLQWYRLGIGPTLADAAKAALDFKADAAL